MGELDLPEGFQSNDAEWYRYCIFKAALSSYLTLNLAHARQAICHGVFTLISYLQADIYILPP